MKQRAFLSQKMILAYCPHMNLQLTSGENYYTIIPGASLGRDLIIAFGYGGIGGLLVIYRIYLNHSSGAVAGMRQVSTERLAPLSELLRQQIAADEVMPMEPVPLALPPPPRLASQGAAAPRLYLHFGPGVSAYQCRVLGQIQRIPMGSTATYGQIAAGAGSPRAYRRVGSICARNPLPLLIPCHRVVAAAYHGPYQPLAAKGSSAKGSGAYQGGAVLKAQLLAQEYICSRRQKPSPRQRLNGSQTAYTPQGYSPLSLA